MGSARAGEWSFTGDGRGGFHNVPLRTRYGTLEKIRVAFSNEESTEDLHSKLANSYAQRTLTKLSATPQNCAEALCWLISDLAAKATGHMIPVDGGLVEAFLR